MIHIRKEMLCKTHKMGRDMQLLLTLMLRFQSNLWLKSRKKNRNKRQKTSLSTIVLNIFIIKKFVIIKSIIISQTKVINTHSVVTKAQL